MLSKHVTLSIFISMKKQLLLILFVACSFFAVNTASAQADLYDTQVVWCGFDFSNAKCIGSDGFTNPQDVKDRFFGAWNDLILAESDKYDVKKFYGKETQINDLSVVSERNEIPEADELVIDEPYAFEEGQLENIIQQYELSEAQEGLGLVYVIESLNKTEQQAVINVVFFDIASNDILWTKKYATKAGGFGLRNYWAAAFRKAMETSGKEFVKEAKKKR